MTLFAEILSDLPTVDDIQRIELSLRGNDTIAAVIENKPGQAGSVRVYHALLQGHGCIDAAAAAEGLRLYAEHTADARAHPGKHPNIERLLEVMEHRLCYEARIVNKGATP